MNATIRTILLIAAMVFAAILVGSGFGWFLEDHPLGWAGAALLCGYASRLP